MPACKHVEDLFRLWAEPVKVMFCRRRVAVTLSHSMYYYVVMLFEPCKGNEIDIYFVQMSMNMVDYASSTIIYPTSTTSSEMLPLKKISVCGLVERY